MSQLSENKRYSIEEILEKLRSEAQKMPVSPTSFRYLRALESVESSFFSLQSSESGQAASDEALKTEDSGLKTALTDWLVNLWLTATPFSTASLYLDIISALYGSAVKAGQLPSTEIFTRLKAALKTLGSKGWSSGINAEIFARALRLTKNAHRLLLDDSIAADLIILSLTHSLIPIQHLAQLKREDLAPTEAGAAGLSSGETSAARPIQLSRYSPANASLHETIIARHLNGNARRHYIFPLRQSERTPAQLKKHVFKMANALFRRARLPQATDPNRTVESLWAYAALTTGVPASQVVACLGQAPLGLPILKLAIGSTPPQRPQREILESSDQDSTAFFAHSRSLREMQEVGKVFLDNPARWYAMSLRPGVRFTQVCRRIQTLSHPSSSQDSRLKTQDFLSDIELFYPCEEIARAIGKKIVIKQRPFIHSVVFFRAKLTDIGPLFARIGDLAWCYRQSARPGAPYADISERQFRLFQQTIATFTPDYEVAPTGELELKKNDRVQIVGGLFAGHEATVDQIGTHGSCVRQPSDRVAGLAGLSSGETATTVYRLNIVGDNGIEWRIKVDPRVIMPGSNAYPHGKGQGQHRQ